MDIRKVLDAEHSEVKYLGADKYKFVISHEAPDLVGDIVVQSGIKPVSKRIPAQVDHSGLMRDVIGHWTDFELRGDHTVATLHIVKEGISKMADLVRSLTESGVRLAASIGFQSKKHEPMPRGIKFLETSLHEVSVVVVPCQPLALQIAKSHGLLKPPPPAGLGDPKQTIFKAMDMLGHDKFDPEWRVAYRVDKLLRKR